jgi:hypothetical protein
MALDLLSSSPDAPAQGRGNAIHGMVETQVACLKAAGDRSPFALGSGRCVSMTRHL